MTAPIIDFALLNKPHWSEENRLNAKSVIEFMKLIMNDHNFDEALKRHSKQFYKQHNRSIPDGIEGVENTMGTW